MAKAKKRGPQNTLVDLPHMAKIREHLAAKGLTSLKEAALEAGMSYDAFLKTCREGLSSDPKQRIVEGLSTLGILELLPHRESA